MPTLDRGRSKHNDLVVQLTRANVRREKILDSLTRINAKRNSLIRSIARSQKRLAKAAVVAQVNAPVDVFKDKPLYETMSPDDLEAARQTSAELNLAIPEFLRR